MKRLLVVALAATLLLIAAPITSSVEAAPEPSKVEVVQANHDYTTVYRYCWKFVPGVWYYAEETTRWAHNWWGSGHYVAWQSTTTYGRCYIS
jgi:hypothetical protein